MLATTTLKSRQAQLTAERETAAHRHEQQITMIDGRLAQLRADLAELEIARSAALARHAQQDYAYAAVIGELQTLLADAQTDDADDAEPGVPVAA
jgi:predicted translin family RNA/ssDNA-binding protein